MNGATHEVPAHAQGVPGKRTRVQEAEQAFGGAAVVQRRARRDANAAASGDDGAVHAAAALGVSGAGGTLPHLDRIQSLFGRHDVSRVRAHTDGAASAGAAAMGAEAFAMGDQVAFAGTPSLHTAAHEAAHVVQQRSGVHLKGGVGAAGDAHERHADEVADRVVAGRSASDLLDRYAGGSSTSASGAVQRQIKKPSGELFENVDDVVAALALEVTSPQRLQIGLLLEEAHPYSLDDVRQKIATKSVAIATPSAEPATLKLRDTILNASCDTFTRARAADDIRYKKDVANVLDELVVGTLNGPWDVISNLLCIVTEKRVVSLLPHVKQLLVRFSNDSDAYGEILTCARALDPQDAWWCQLLLSQPHDERSLQILGELPWGKALDLACMEKFLLLPGGASELKTEIVTSRLGDNKKLLKRLLEHEKGDTAVRAEIQSQLDTLGADDSSSEEEPKQVQVILAPKTCVRIHANVNAQSTGTGINVQYVTVAGREAWIVEHSSGSEYDLILSKGEKVELDRSQFTVVELVTMPSEVQQGLKVPKGPKIDRPVLSRGESGDVPYDEHSLWPKLQVSFESLGFKVVCVYQERKQHVVVHGKRNIENTSSVIVKREVHVGKGKTSTTYSDLEHEFSHAEQQHDYLMRTGKYKASEVTIQQGLISDEGPLSELSDKEDAYGEVHAYMQEFIRLTDRQELTTAGESVASIQQRVATHQDKITSYSVVEGEQLLPGFAAIAKRYAEAVEQYWHT